MLQSHQPPVHEFEINHFMILKIMKTIKALLIKSFSLLTLLIHTIKSSNA